MNWVSACVSGELNLYLKIPMYHLPIAVNSPNHLSGDWRPNRSDERLLYIWFYCATHGFALKPNLHSQLKIAPHASFDIRLSVRYSEQRDTARSHFAANGGEGGGAKSRAQIICMQASLSFWLHLHQDWMFFAPSENNSFAVRQDSGGWRGDVVSGEYCNFPRKKRCM